MTLQYHPSIPLYHQVAQLLRSRLETQGAQAPALTEKALCAEYGVSRTTIRQALDALKRDGLLQSRRGVGTRFLGAASKPRTTDSGDPLHAGLGSRPRIVSLGKAPAPAAVAAFFGIAPDEPVLRFVRLQELEAAPLSVIISYLPASLAGMVTRAALRRPLHEVLWERGGIRQHRSVHTISVARADQRIASLLGVALTDPVLRIQSAVHLEDGSPIRWADNYFREDRYQYRAELLWEMPGTGPAAAPRRRKTR
jgi:GntR family transcriptional regulator